MLSLNDIKIIFYGPDFATKALSPRRQKKKKRKKSCISFLESFFLIWLFF